MTHLFLISSADQVDEGFTYYTVMGKGLYCEMDDIVTYLIVTCNDKIYVSTVQCVMHQRGLHATIVFVLEVRGVNVITCI